MSRRMRRKTCRDLLMILRHNALLHGLPIQSNGFVQMDSLLKLPAFLGEEVADIRRVAEDFRPHLELAQFPETNPTRDELWYIRARNGHTIESILIPERPISTAEAHRVTAVLCISKKNWKRIKRAGAVYARCGYITFEPRLPESNLAQAVLAFLDVARTLRSGIQVFWSTTGKIISPGDTVNTLSLDLFSRIQLPSRTGRRAPSGNDLSTDTHPEPTMVVDSRRWLGDFISNPAIQRQCLTYVVSKSVPHKFRPTIFLAASRSVGLGQTASDDDDVSIITSAPGPTRSPRSPDNASTHREPVLSGELLPSSFNSENTPKWLIIPIAIPGCGKTGVCAALAYLFKLCHVHVGDVWEPPVHPSARNSYLDAVSAALNDCLMVVADRNNHLRQHRAVLRDVCKSYTRSRHAEVKTLVLNWTIRQPSPQIVYRQCARRILSWRRGQQWFDTSTKTPLHKVLWNFLDHAEPLEAREADAVIDMDPLESLEQSVRRAVTGFVDILALAAPTEERIAAAIRAAQAYHPKGRMS